MNKLLVRNIANINDNLDIFADGAHKSPLYQAFRKGELHMMLFLYK